MKLSHEGMGITEADWSAFWGHMSGTLAHFDLPAAEKEEVCGFVASLKGEIVES